MVRPAADALLADDSLALGADTGHPRLRIERMNRMMPTTPVEIARTNRTLNARGRTADRIREAMAASNTGCCGQGRRGADYTVASRLLQFLCSLLKVLVDGTPDEFRHRSARLFGQRP